MATYLSMNCMSDNKAGVHTSAPKLVKKHKQALTSMSRSKWRISSAMAGRLQGSSCQQRRMMAASWGGQSSGMQGRWLCTATATQICRGTATFSRCAHGWTREREPCSTSSHAFKSTSGADRTCQKVHICHDCNACQLGLSPSTFQPL